MKTATSPRLTLKQSRLLDEVREYRLPSGEFYAYDVPAREGSVARALAQKKLVILILTLPNGNVRIRAVA